MPRLRTTKNGEEREDKNQEEGEREQEKEEREPGEGNKKRGTCKARRKGEHEGVVKEIIRLET